MVNTAEYCKKWLPESEQHVHSDWFIYACINSSDALLLFSLLGWAHVVCALYVPEVMFGDNTTMEPILISRVSRDKYGKVCYLCAQQNRQAEAGCGACIKCARTSCRTVFHVTCGQSAGLLREEPHGPGSSSYKGYCNLHMAPFKSLTLPIYSSPFREGAIRADSQQSQEDGLNSHISTDVMSQDGDNQVNATGEGESSDSMAAQHVIQSMPTTPTKAHLAAKAKRNVAAKVKAKSVRHQRVLKRGRNGKTLPSAKRQKTDKEPEGCNTGSMNKEEPLAGNSTNTSTSTIDWSSSNGIESHDKQTNSVINSQREEQVPPSSVLPFTLEEFLDQQWKRGQQFLIDELGQCDASTLVETLKRLRAENNDLTKQISDLSKQKERLLAASKKQSVPIACATDTTDSSSKLTNPQSIEKTLNGKDLVLGPPPTELLSQAKKMPVKAVSVSKSPPTSFCKDLERSCPPDERKDEEKCFMKANRPSKTPKQRSEKTKRSTKGKAKMIKDDKVGNETLVAKKNQNQIPAKNMSPEKTDVLSKSSSVIPLNSTEPVTLGPLSASSQNTFCLSSAASNLTSSVPVSSLSAIIELSEVKAPIASQISIKQPKKKKKKSTSEKGKKTNNNVITIDQSTTPPQLSTGHSVSSLLGDQSHSHPSFYTVLPSMLPDRASSPSFSPVGTIHSPLYYSQHPHYSGRIPVPQHTGFSSDYVANSSPTPSRVSMHIFDFE
jgi:hypothetical protein